MQLWLGVGAQFSSVVQSCPILCNPMNCSTPGLLVHHQLLELAQTHVHRVVDAIQSSPPLSFPSPPAFNLSQHQDLFQSVSSSNQVAKVLGAQGATKGLKMTWMQPILWCCYFHRGILVPASQFSRPISFPLPASAHHPTSTRDASKSREHTDYLVNTTVFVTLY